MKKHRQAGFTLIEVMVAMLIVAILVAIGWPIFQNYELKNRRAQAVDWLSQLRLEMERCMSNNTAGNTATYNGCDANAPPNVTPIIQQKYPNIFYNVAIAIPDPATGDGFRLTATEIPGDDLDCTSLFINHLGNKGYTGASPNTIRCWGSN